jgi:acyl-CoA thioester hydrolase
MTGTAGPVFEMVRQPLAEDIDELGHVNNAVYVRWIQDVATAHWRAVADPAHVASVIWLVVRHEIDYRAPSHLGETLTIRTWVGTPKGARFDRHVEICGADGRARVQAVTTWALVDPKSRRPMRVTDAIAAPFTAATGPA